MKFKKYSLDKKELLILSELRKNSRQSLAEISRKTNMPISTIFDKLRKLKEGLIIKHTPLINFSKLGFNIKAVLLVKTNKKEELKDFLTNHKNINSVHRLDRDYDYIVETIFQNMGEFFSFKEEIEIFGIEKMNYYYIEEDVKREGILSSTEEFP